MKKVLSMILVCTLMLGCVFALSSCGGPSGTYEGELGVGTYTFSGNTYTHVTKVANISSTVTGTFKMGEDEKGKTIIFTTGEGEKATTTTFSYSEGREDDVFYIKIGSIRYNKK